ncbi:MAG: hypothetical protein BMS9Abin17_1011 [Acidimicrobiia bacterium]|nr:MAG: hypothetical protein BMS9Abin17_1011 [Acidimicrobiia bacterium]
MNEFGRGSPTLRISARLATAAGVDVVLILLPVEGADLHPTVLSRASDESKADAQVSRARSISARNGGRSWVTVAQTMLGSTRQYSCTRMLRWSLGRCGGSDASSW